MGGNLSALALSHRFVSEHVRPGDLCIDATAGRGRDTALLRELVGDAGRVLAFDIQQEALDSTAALLREKSYDDVRLILDSHANMARYAEPDSVSCIAFNFGWLPGGDHTVFTRPESSVAAIRAGLSLLKPGGVMSLCLYFGRENGCEERDTLLRFLGELDERKYTVVAANFLNRPHNPIPIFLIRDF